MIDLLCALLVFVWNVPVMLVVGLLKYSSSKKLGFVWRDFVKAVHDA